jgi:hypothetical protein
MYVNNNIIIIIIIIIITNLNILMSLECSCNQHPSAEESHSSINFSPFIFLHSLFYIAAIIGFYMSEEAALRSRRLDSRGPGYKRVGALLDSEAFLP